MSKTKRSVHRFLFLSIDEGSICSHSRKAVVLSGLLLFHGSYNICPPAAISLGLSNFIAYLTHPALIFFKLLASFACLMENQVSKIPNYYKFCRNWCLCIRKDKQNCTDDHSFCQQPACQPKYVCYQPAIRKPLIIISAGLEMTYFQVS